MGSRRWLIFLGGLSLLGVAGGVWYWAAHREPVYQGYPVTYWILEMSKPGGPLLGFGMSDWNADTPPKQAIRYLGSQAIPYLVKAISWREGYYSKWFKKHGGQVYSVAPLVFKFLPRPVPLGNAKDQSMRMLEEFFQQGVGGYKAVLPTLTSLLESPDATEQHWAAHQFILIAARYHDPKARSAMDKCLASANLRGLVVRYLSSYGSEMRPCLPGILNCLHGTAGAERIDAAVAAYRIGGLQEEPVQVLIEALRAPTPNDRRSAAYCLSRIGPAAKSATPALERLRDDPDPFISSDALLALRKIAPSTYGAQTNALDRNARANVAKLIAQLRSGDQNGQRFAAQQLARLGAGAQPAIPLLLTNLCAELRGGHAVLPVYNVVPFADAILAIDPSQATNVARLLVPALRSSANTWVPGGVPNCLARMGTAAQVALPALIQGLDDEQIGRQCAWALIEVGGPEWIHEPEVYHLLVDSLNRKHPVPGRLSALRKLGELGQSASVTIPAIQALLQDENEEVRMAAQAALEKIDPKPTAGNSTRQNH